MPMLHFEATGSGDSHIDNGVFLRFGFDDFEVLRKFQIVSRTKQQRNALGMLYLYNLNYAR